MKKTLTVLSMAGFIALGLVGTTAAIAHTEHHQGQTEPGAQMNAHAGMMGNGMMGNGMMGPGIMNHQIGHLFFLDRAEELGLSSEQVDKLRILQTECRRDNIRNVAELNIVRLELADLLATDNWSLQDAENLIRKVKKMEGDIQIRHLQALNAARKILTEEQRKQAQ